MVKLSHRQVWDLWYELVDADGKFGEDNSKHETASVWTTLQKTVPSSLGSMVKKIL